MCVVAQWYLEWSDVLVSLLRFFARRRLVKTENPSAFATMNWKCVRTSVTALYCMYLSVINRKCVTKVLMNPIIRTRTRHFVTSTTLHVTIYIPPRSSFAVLCSRLIMHNGANWRGSSYILQTWRKKQIKFPKFVWLNIPKMMCT
jgi:hypothetical protein